MCIILNEIGGKEDLTYKLNGFYAKLNDFLLHGQKSFHNRVLWQSVRGDMVTIRLLITVDVGSCLSAILCDFQWACLWLLELPDSTCKWNISTVKPQHVSSHSATHQHRPGWKTHATLYVCHLPEVSQF